MTVYRFCSHKYRDDLSGNGARLYGGRWNNKGFAALYTSSNISLSLLEILVNALDISALQSLSLMRIEIPEQLEQSVYKIEKLKNGWHLDFDYTKWIGSEFLQKREHLYLQCPSAVVFEEQNFMLNPLHKDFNKIKLLPSNDFVFDKRLFKVQQ